MQTVGRHLIIELFGCEPSRIDDLEHVASGLKLAAKRIGASVVSEAFHRYAPQGVSGILLIAESHLSVHTWPERGYVAVDIYTCGGLDPRPGTEAMAEQFGATQWREQETVRGLPEEVEQAREWMPHDVLVVPAATQSGRTEPKAEPTARA